MTQTRGESGDESNSAKELELLVKEYEALRAQIITHIASHAQFATLAVLLAGGVLTAAPFLLFSGSSAQQLRFPPIYLIIALLGVALLFISLMWVFVERDLEVAITASYFMRKIRPRALELIGQPEGQATIFGWDRFRTEFLFPKGRKFFFYRTMMSLVAVSRYALVFIPAVACLTGAIVMYFTFSLFPPMDTVGWFEVGLFTFDLLYLTLLLPFGAIVYGAYTRMERATSTKRASKAQAS